MPNFEDILKPTKDGRYWGKYEAIVADVNDPEDRGRIRVKQKFFYGVNFSPWAKPCFQYGGSSEVGEIFLPEIGAGVWIEFQYGIPELPIWTGFWVSKPNGVSELPTENKGKSYIKTIKTKKFLIMIDDQNSTLVIKNNVTGNSITINESTILLGGNNKSIIYGEDLIQWINNHTHNFTNADGIQSTTDAPVELLEETILSPIKVK